MWSLYENDSSLKPLVFSNGKSQEDIVKEIIEAIDEDHRVIFIRGVCGTGKSAIALNLAKEIGKASVVVPSKALQKQYEDDYTSKKYLLKQDGQKLKISVITGRANHICPFLQVQKNMQGLVQKEQKDFKLSDFRDDFENNNGNNESDEKYNIEKDYILCDNPFLPCRIEIKEKNAKRIREYLKKNPKIDMASFVSIKDVRRMSIAPICPYWSPIVPSEIILNLEANRKNYIGLMGRKYTIYQRKYGCNYYDQFDAYIDADVIIFNSQKYKLETLMNRKPATEIEIIDECDEFLDSFSNIKKININRLNLALAGLYTENNKINKIIEELIELTNEFLKDKDKEIEKHILNDDIIHIKNSEILDLLRHFLDSNLMNIVECDEENYCYHIEEVAKTFNNFFDETYLCFNKERGYRDKGKELIVRLVTTNLEKKFKELLDKNKIIVLMSGTIHSENVLKNIFGLDSFKIIEAETKTPGKIDFLRTRCEMDCKYDNFQKGKITRKQYLEALSKCIEKAKKPVLVHVNSFKDLPSKQEAREFGLNIMTREKLRYLQQQDSVGEAIKEFKQGKIDILFSTKCNRGADFPGETCNSIILTKYPYPNINSLFWRILKKTRPQYYNMFYIDKARREFLQRIYRGLRSQEDHIFLLSPDVRVFRTHNFYA